MKTLLLIDANSLIHRCFHALPPLTSNSGQATGALYGLSSILLKIMREEKPDYAAALFDRPEPTFRKEIYADYKAQRPAAPDDLISQIIETHNLFLKFGIKTFEKPGLEADDLIASLAFKFQGQSDLKIVILTGDMDTLQLVKRDKVVVKSFKKGISDTVVYDEESVKNRYGLKPEQLIDYKVLVGDVSDNIKGVPGVGPKTAATLLQEFGDLENIYKNLDSKLISPKIKDGLQKFQKQIAISKKLVSLKKDADLEFGNLEDLKLSENKELLSDYFKNFGFETLIKRLNSGDDINNKAKSQGQIFVI